MKKVLCLLLTLAMAICLIPGCQQQSEPAAAEESSAAAEEAAEASVSDAAPAEAAEEAPAEAPAEEAEPVEEIDYTNGLSFTQYPLVDEGENAEFLLWTDSVIGLSSFYDEGFAQHPVYLAMEDYTGVHIEFKTTNETTSSEEFNLMVVSGDYPDMVHRMSYSGGFDLAVEEDFAIDLTPYIEEYAPNYNYLIHMDNDEYYKSIVTDGGYIASFYCFNNDYTPAKEGLLIRADWLDELGLEKPKTYDQMHDVLTAFKTEKGATEAFLMPSETNATAIVGGYGTLGAATSSSGMTSSSDGTYYVKDGKLCFGLLDASFKDFLVMVRSWVDEGLVSPTYQTDNDKPLSNTYTINISQGVSGVINSNTSMVDDYQYAGEDYNGEGYRIESTYDLRLNEDDTLHFETAPTKVGDQGITITTACEDIPLAMQWCDFWYSTEMTTAQRWGVEGESYTVDEEGNCQWTQQMITPPDGYNSMIYKAKYTLTINLIGDVYADFYQYSDAMLECSEIWSDNADSDWTMPSAVAMNADEAERYSNIYSDIDTYVSENLSKFMVGDMSFDQWDSFIQQVYDMGIEECIEIYQGAYDRYIAK